MKGITRLWNKKDSFEVGEIVFFHSSFYESTSTTPGVLPHNDPTYLLDTDLIENTGEWIKI